MIIFIYLFCYSTPDIVLFEIKLIFQVYFISKGFSRFYREKDTRNHKQK